MRLDIPRETVQEAIRELEGQWLRPAGRQLLKALEWAVEGEEVEQVPERECVRLTSTDERLAMAAIQCGEDKGRIRELEEEKRNLIEQCNSVNATSIWTQDKLNHAMNELKIMTEDRDEYRNAIRVCAPITGLLKSATEDERAIVRMFVAKLMGEGRREHGALDLATDERDLMGEAKDELDDSISYLLMVRRRMEGKARMAGLALGKVGTAPSVDSPIAIEERLRLDPQPLSAAARLEAQMMRSDD